MEYSKIHHIGIAVDDLNGMIEIFTKQMGLNCERVTEYSEFGVRVAFFRVGKSFIELIQGTNSSNAISQIVAKQGNILHHVCLAVDGIDSALNELSSRGVTLTDRVARRLDENTRFAFVDPSASGGVTFEVYEESKSNMENGR